MSTDDEAPPEEKVPLVKETLSTVGDERIMAQIEHWEHVMPHLTPVRTYLRETRLHLDPSEWGAGFLSVHEYNIPYYLKAAMKECTPQPLLRDLERIEYPFSRIVRKPIAIGPPAIETDARRDIGAALERRPAASYGSGLGAVAELQRLQHEIRKEPWKAALADDAPRRPTYV